MCRRCHASTLLKLNALPLLTYAYEAVNMSAAQVHVLSVCWNNVYRRHFRMHQWESVKMLQLLCGRLNLCRLFDLRKLWVTTPHEIGTTITHETKSIVKQNKYT